MKGKRTFIGIEIAIPDDRDLFILEIIGEFIRQMGIEIDLLVSHTNLLLLVNVPKQ